MEEIVAGFTRDQLTIYIGIFILALLIIVFVLSKIFSGRENETELEIAPAAAVEGMASQVVATPEEQVPLEMEGKGRTRVLFSFSPLFQVWQVQENEKIVVTRFGRLHKVLGPGVGVMGLFQQVHTIVPLNVMQLNLPVEELLAKSRPDSQKADIEVGVDIAAYLRVYDAAKVALDLSIGRDVTNSARISLQSLVGFIIPLARAALKDFVADRTVDQLAKIDPDEKAYMVRELELKFARFGFASEGIEIERISLRKEFQQKRQETAERILLGQAAVEEARLERKARELSAKAEAFASEVLIRVAQEAKQKGLSEVLIVEALRAQKELTMTGDTRQNIPTSLVIGSGSGQQYDPIVFLLLQKFDELNRRLSSLVEVGDITQGEASAVTEGVIEEVAKSLKAKQEPEEGEDQNV